MSGNVQPISHPSEAANDRAQSPWLVSPLWDTTWMFSGLWLLAIIMLTQAFGKGAGSIYWLAIVGWVVLWGGHIVAPIVGAWSRAELRSDILEQPARYIALPAALFLISCVFGVFAGEGAADATPFLMVNYRFTGLGTGFMLFFIVWNIWHFSSQHFGVLSIYRVRKGQFAPEDRTWDRRFTILMTCGLVPLAWYSQGRRLGAVIEVLPTPDPQGLLAYSVVIASVLLTAYAIFREYQRPNSSTPKMIYFASVGIQPIIGVLAYSLYHFAVFSMAHWLVAIALSARVTSNAATESSGPAATWQRSFALQVAILIAISLVAYVLVRSSVIPTAFSAIAKGSVPDSVNMQVVGLIAGAGTGASLVHFIYDRYLYSFHRPIIRKAVSTHLFQQP